MTGEFGIAAAPPRAGEDAAHFVSANGIWLHILEYGSGSSELVFIPGMTAAAATMGFAARELAGRFRTLVLDVRGRGLSSHPPTGFTLDDYAADLAGAVTRLRLRRPLLVGHSMGARIAAAFDVAYPNVARGLVLVDPPLSGPNRTPYPYPLAMYQEFFRVAKAPNPSIDAFRMFEPQLSDEQIRDRVRWLRQCDEHAIYETHRLFHEESFHRLYAGLHAPTLLVRGQHSVVVTDEGAAELAALRPDIPIVTIEKAGHLVPQDNLPGFLAAIEDLADRVEGPGQASESATLATLDHASARIAAARRAGG